MQNRKAVFVVFSLFLLIGLGKVIIPARAMIYSPTCPFYVSQDVYNQEITEADQNIAKINSELNKIDQQVAEDIQKAKTEENECFTEVEDVKNINSDIDKICISNYNSAVELANSGKTDPLNQKKIDNLKSDLKKYTDYKNCIQPQDTEKKEFLSEQNGRCLALMGAHYNETTKECECFGGKIFSDGQCQDPKIVDTKPKTKTNVSSKLPINTEQDENPQKDNTKVNFTDVIEVKKQTNSDLQTSSDNKVEGFNTEQNNNLFVSLGINNFFKKVSNWLSSLFN